MRRFGFILVAVGLALLVYLGYWWYQQRNQFVSPVPEEKGVKVIYE